MFSRSSSGSLEVSSPPIHSVVNVDFSDLLNITSPLVNTQLRKPLVNNLIKRDYSNILEYVNSITESVGALDDSADHLRDVYASCVPEGVFRIIPNITEILCTGTLNEVQLERNSKNKVKDSNIFEVCIMKDVLNNVPHRYKLEYITKTVCNLIVYMLEEDVSEMFCKNLSLNFNSVFIYLHNCIQDRTGQMCGEIDFRKIYMQLAGCVRTLFRVSVYLINIRLSIGHSRIFYFVNQELNKFNKCTGTSGKELCMNDLFLNRSFTKIIFRSSDSKM